jgi:hypothetical protein
MNWRKNNLSQATTVLPKTSLADNKHFEVGRGQRGAVFALNGTNSVIKIPNSSLKVGELFNDYQIHHLVYSAVAPFRSMKICVPRLKGWVIPQNNTFRDDMGALFPKETPSIPSFGPISERIESVPLWFCEAIVDALCPKAIKKTKTEFLARPENRDCLVRLYLGRRSDTCNMEARNIRLRNFPLHINEMDQLNLDPESFAITMA